MKALDQIFGLLALATVISVLFLLALFDDSYKLPRKGALKPLYLPEFNVPAQFLSGYGPAFNGDPAQTQKYMPFNRVQIRHSGCFGSCPRYSVIFNSDLSAVLEIQGSCRLPVGTYQARIPAKEFVRLNYMLTAMKFMEFKKQYRAPWTDDDECVISVNSGASKFEVRNYGRFGPPELDCVQAYIESLALETFHNFR